MNNIEQKIHHYTKRMDQTLSHLQVSSAQIYLIDGALLAFGYFVAEKFIDSPGGLPLLAFLSFLLFFINFFHVQFIRTQSHWFCVNDSRIRQLMEERDSPRPSGCFNSSHSNHRVFTQ